MQRYFAIFSILVLLFMQCSTSIALAAESTRQNQNKFEVYVKDGSTQDKTTVELKSLVSEYERITIKLPEDAVYDEKRTGELEQGKIKFSYVEKTHTLEMVWNKEQDVSFVLVDLQSPTNNLIVQGIVQDEVVVEETHSFKVAEIEVKINEEEQKEVEEEDKQKSGEDAAIAKEDDKTSEEATIESEDEEEPEKEQEIEKEVIKEEKKDANITKAEQTSSNNETRENGEGLEDLNTFLSIDPVFETALSGADANFKLTLKLTGSKRTYKNVDVVLDLPIEEHITFDDAQENLESLAIDGVTPTFNNVSNQLTYHFDEIKRGQMYEKIISLNTENGYILDGTSVEVDASISGEIHYTENDEKEEAQKGDVVSFDYADSGSMLITASGALSLSKFRVNESEHEYGDSSIVARGQEVLWKLELEIPKKDRGQLFLNPDEKITVTDLLPAELEYVEMHSGVEPISVDNQTLTWEFDVDDFDTQAEKGTDLYSKEIVIKTNVSDNALKGEMINNATASATFIDEIVVTANASRGVRVAIDDPNTGEILGTVTVPTHLGPDPSSSNGLGDNDNKNPRPEVTDDTILKFSHGIAPMNESFPDSDQYPSGNLGPAKNFIEFQTFYEIDQHLNLESIRAPGPFQFKPNNAYPSGEFFNEQPRYDIKARIDGGSSFQTLVKADDVIPGKVYTREELGLQPGQKVSEITIEFLKGYMGNSNEVAPGGMQSTNTVLFEFSIDKGFTGTVENKFNVTGVNGNNERFNDREKNPNRYDNSTGSDISGPRQATVIEYNQQAAPVGRVGVKLLEDVRGVVTNGNNRMQVELVNVNNSGAPMNSILETVVLLPPGVTLHDEVNPSYTNGKGENTDAASYEVLEEDYNGSGRQLVRVKWDDARITKGQNLQAELDVYISDYAPNQLIFDVYGFSSDEGLQAPSNTGGGITDTVLQIDTEDLNGNGNTEQPRLKSGNIYSLTGKYDIQTEKLIKGPNDEDFSKFTFAPFDGIVDYKLKMTNTTGKDLSSMTLIDVLPTVGDLGITDNVNRGSTFEPTLEGPIDLPASWQDKVNVSYSTAKNPERDDLTRHTDYGPNAPRLTNPEGAEVPNWVPAFEVTDWSTIHSFKIELQPGSTWIKGQDIEIDFSMKMPQEDDVDEDVTNLDLVPQQRAAWNSFAVATDQGQPVEPERVGVAIETFIDISVEKVWVGEAQDEVTINLLADGEVIATIDLSDENNWQHVFENLPTANGANKIDYTIEEVEIDGYNTDITGSAEEGFVATNTELTNIPVEKVWEGEAQDEVTINLLADGEEVATIDLSDENNWQYVFENLPAANSEGTIAYTIEEVSIDGYNSNITGNAAEGFVVTNTELMNIPVEKIWEGEAQDEVTINLLADGEEVATIDLSDENNWQYVFENLPAANSEGTIAYTIEEVSIDGYDSNITGNAAEGFIVTNTELTSIPVEKIWEGVAQGEVTINLLADGEEVGTIVLSDENNWEHIFEGLPVVSGEDTIAYTVEEVSVDGYDANITGNAEDGFTVTNTELINIQVEKVWEGEAQDEVTINLLANGEEVTTIDLSDENNWQHVFENLPAANSEGTIAYTIEEVSINGYDSNITGNAAEGFVVTNTELMNIPVEKIWEGEAQDEVTINLLADSEEVATINLSDENNWQHVFENLPAANSEGTIAYTIEEVSIDGYDSNITGNAAEGFIVTNTELTNITVEKVWQLYEKNKENVIIILLADGEEANSVQLSEDNGWKYTFENLPAAKGADAIVYTIEEVEIDGFEVEITGDAQDGFTVTNKEIVPPFPIVPGKTKVDVEKVWEGEAQESVMIHLLADGEKIDSIELSADNDWKHTFKDLPIVHDVTDESVIVYTVEEVEVDGYETNITGNKQDGFVVTNTLNPPETPDVEKEVENNDGEYGKELVEKEREKEYNYRVNTVVPERLLGYKYLTLADELDDRLDVKDAVALVDGEKADYEVEIDGQLVTLKVDREQLDEIAGQELTLQITAQIKAGVEVEVIDNEATIQVNDNPSEKSNKVPVIPPPEIEKDIEGEKAVEPVEKLRGQEYDYNVTTTLPEDVSGFKIVTISDELDKRLSVVDAKVLVDGEASDVQANIDGQLVTVLLENGQIEPLAGTEIKLVITAKINADVEVEVIDNQASIQVNDNPKVDSNIVPVIPPATPNIEKDVEGSEHLDIDFNKEYNYNIITALPSNIKDYEKFMITDNVDPGLVVIADQVVATVDGEVYEGLELTIDGNDVKVEVTDFSGLDGKEQIELVIPAKIHPNTNIDEYTDNKIPNTVDLDFTNESGEDSKITTKPVTVTPPPTPDVEKEVEDNDGAYGKELIEKEREKAYNYRVNTVIPEELTSYVDLTLADELDDRLDVIGAVALVGGEEVDYEVIIDGQLVTLNVDREQLDEIAGQKLTLQITAQIKADVEVEEIDNQATIQVNDNPIKESNIVPVTPPPADPPTTPNIDKDVEGTDHINIDYDQEYKYNVTTTLPSNIEKYGKFVISDKVDKGLVVNAKKVTATVDGEAYDGLELTVDGNDIKVEVTDFAGLAGKGQIELVITAKIHPNTNIDAYKDNKIPNTADLDFTNESGEEGKITTDPVTVTPPPVDPPTTPEDPEVPKDPEDPKVDGSGDELPKTATNIYNLTLIGFGLMLLGLIIFLARRKRIE